MVGNSFYFCNFMFEKEKPKPTKAIKSGFSAQPLLVDEAKEAAKVAGLTYSGFCQRAIAKEVARNERSIAFQRLIDDAIEAEVPIAELEDFIKKWKNLSILKNAKRAYELAGGAH